MDEITFQVTDSEGWLVASWNDPSEGGITTQARDLGELERNVREAVEVHFDSGRAPKTIRLHFVADLILSQT